MDISEANVKPHMRSNPLDGWTTDLRDNRIWAIGVSPLPLACQQGCSIFAPTSCRFEFREIPDILSSRCYRLLFSRHPITSKMLTGAFIKFLQRGTKWKTHRHHIPSVLGKTCSFGDDVRKTPS